MPFFALGADDFARIRFGLSELQETVSSIRALQRRDGQNFHTPWIARARPLLDAELLRPLLAVVPHEGFMADCITPVGKGDESFDEMVAAIVASPNHRWDADLASLRADNPQSAPVLDELRGRAGRVRVADHLTEYHRRVIAPDWPRLRALGQADIAWRTEQLAKGGVEALFRDLHPQISLHSDGVNVTGACVTSGEATGRGLLLVPSAFAWPGVFSLVAPEFQATITYAPRGLGNLWSTDAVPSLDALEKLIGHTRATILRQLDLPMSTTQVACALDLSAAAVNGHLKVLLNSGVAETSRAGRSVLYRRSRLGESLLTR